MPSALGDDALPLPPRRRWPTAVRPTPSCSDRPDARRAGRARVLACRPADRRPRPPRPRAGSPAPRAASPSPCSGAFPPRLRLPAGLSLAVGVAVARALESRRARRASRSSGPTTSCWAGASLPASWSICCPAAASAPAAVIGIGLNVSLPAGFSSGRVRRRRSRRRAARAAVAQPAAGAVADRTRWGADPFSAARLHRLRESWMARHALAGRARCA
ncbi:MAG: hypothetical protein MZW92_80765 [Comamonadaceae bacterium]|nr:hypothetical protein [Comamonadaceae bacterium]